MSNTKTQDALNLSNIPDIPQVPNISNSNEDMFEYDELKMFFGEDYIVNDKIKIHMPSIGEIIEYGEKEYYSMVYSLTAIPSDMKSSLFDMGLDYENVSDFELFYILTRGITSEKSYVLLYDLDLSKMEMCQDTTNGLYVMYDREKDIVIDQLAYAKMVDYLRKVHSIKPKVEKAKNQTTKRILIQLDRDRIAKSKKEKYKSSLKPLISAMMRYPGFKYKSFELKQCSLYEFMDAVQGAQIYVSSTALIQGSYSGMIDTSKINRKEFNWMRGLDE